MNITRSIVFFFFATLLTITTVKNEDMPKEKNDKIKKISTKKEFEEFVGQNLTTVMFVLVNTGEFYNK